MKRKLHTYESDDIVVQYDLKRCIHAAECVRGLPEVFDPDRSPWIDPTRSEADAIADVVERCPTGALQYRRTDGGPGELPDDENHGTIEPGGPVYVRGRLEIEMPDGSVFEDTRVALCRCGASRDKPFCDGSHEDVEFDDPGLIEGGRLVPAEEVDDPPTGAVRFTCASDGPLLVQGPLRLRDAGDEIAEGCKGALCRCGHSASKPFCDGSHKAAGFTAA